MYHVIGSSPRVRGAGHVCDEGRGGQRIIPGRAGSRTPLRPPPAASRDHPRTCGEQLCLSRLPDGLAGSSPRVRGAGPPWRQMVSQAGIIPARAGSSATGWTCESAAGDHPRACGEQQFLTSLSEYVSGSSPRVRGAVLEYCDLIDGLGIIPARAGSRRCRPSWTAPSRDHPRACGEQPVSGS